MGHNFQSNFYLGEIVSVFDEINAEVIQIIFQLGRNIPLIEVGYFYNREYKTLTLSENQLEKI